MKFCLVNSRAFFLLILLVVSCNTSKKYQARWIVTEVEYKGENVLDYMTQGNMTIDFERKGLLSIPAINCPPYDGKSSQIPVSYKLIRSEGKDFLTINGTSFFTDTFEVKCLTKNCCEIELLTDEKYVKLIFNSELYGRNRRNCPTSMSVLKQLGW